MCWVDTLSWLIKPPDIVYRGAWTAGLNQISLCSGLRHFLINVPRPSSDSVPLNAQHVQLSEPHYNSAGSEQLYLHKENRAMDAPATHRVSCLVVLIHDHLLCPGACSGVMHGEPCSQALPSFSVA